MGRARVVTTTERDLLKQLQVERNEFESTVQCSRTHNRDLCETSRTTRCCFDHNDRHFVARKRAARRIATSEGLCSTVTRNEHQHTHRSKKRRRKLHSLLTCTTYDFCQGCEGHARQTNGCGMQNSCRQLHCVHTCLAACISSYSAFLTNHTASSDAAQETQLTEKNPVRDGTQKRACAPQDTTRSSSVMLRHKRQLRHPAVRGPESLLIVAPNV